MGSFSGLSVLRTQAAARWGQTFLRSDTDRRRLGRLRQQWQHTAAASVEGEDPGADDEPPSLDTLLRRAAAARGPDRDRTERGRAQDSAGSADDEAADASD